MAAKISPDQLYEKLKTRQSLTLLDVRDPNEFSHWALYESSNVPLNELPKTLQSFSPKGEIITISNHGKSSQRAASLLAAVGHPARSLEGGLKLWNSIYDIVPIEEKYATCMVFQCKRLGKGCLSYIVVLPDASSCMIVDPTHHIDTYTTFLKANRLSAVAVVDTHVHADHVSGGNKLAQKLSVPYFLPKRSRVDFPFRPIEHDLAHILSAQVTVIRTPGHTRESVCILLEESFLFTGDTLFVDAVARADLTESGAQANKTLYTSVTQKLFPLDERLMVLPAHTAQAMMPGPVRAATLRYVKLFNPIRDMPGPQAFLTHIKKTSGLTPPNHCTIKAINTSGRSAHKDIDELELGGNHCASIASKTPH